ncbi:putative leucine-rich repeat receptor-like protein kinase [Ananas comosus]|uniref:Putative leucine-rich repeat receptor-like protein kinase n=1 Tax=Ananas comosus TaxID=4615 RepID=A0A199VQ65_ANACO|nr:putative leucine-rich repeat receptor-like protein kinase [Ananas comosus]
MARSTAATSSSSPFSIFIAFVFFSVPSSSLSSPHPNPDLPILIAFKFSASDPDGALSSWDPSGDPCSGSWRGVSCRGGRVSGVVLEGLRLRGPIDALARLPRLSLLSLKNNSFAVPLHRLDLTPWRQHVKLLFLSHNHFSGTFPLALLGLRHLRRLDLAGNLLSGAVPPEIGHRLAGLFTLRLEDNLLAGAIPVSIAEIAGLADLNVSSNRLEGEIPRRLASFPPSSFAANPDLCGDPLPRRCPLRTAGADPARIPKRGKNRLALAAGIAAAAISAAAAAVLLCFKRRVDRGKKRVSTAAEAGEKPRETRERRTEEDKMVFFEGCEEFEVEELMRGSAEMLGRGTVGSTYRVVMENGKEEEEGVVVKRVRRERSRSRRRETRECVGGGRKRKEEEEEEEEEELEEEEGLLREMGGWRHPNVVSLRAYYSSEHELLLVFDYVTNGSLHNLLHGGRGPGRIPVDWPTRLKLAEDAAKGLAYLHGASHSELSHLHLTSSNILVDNGASSALVSDFSLLRLLSPRPPPSTAEASQKNDVYDFGAILLEILTGRSAECGGGVEDLPTWAGRVVREEWTHEVFDVEILSGSSKEAEDEMVGLLQVALLCVAREPEHRPRMGVVYKMIEDIRDRGSRRSRRSLSPSSNGRSFQSSPCVSEDTPALSQ